MAQTTLISSISRSTTYPVSVPISATNNCGMLMLILNGTWTDQMVSELPAINIKLYVDSTTVYTSFNVNMRTVSDYNFRNPTEPYTLPIYDIPQSCMCKLTPIFDDTALDCHNEMIRNGIVPSLNTSNGIVDNETDTSLYWTTPTSTFDISIIFDNSNVKAGGSSGGGGGGGGSSAATDITFNPLGTGLVSTNVQDAIVELLGKTSTSVQKTVTLNKALWTNSGEYTITDSDITATSDIYITLPENTSDANYAAIAIANLAAVSQSNGHITIKAHGTVPTIDTEIVLKIVTNA